MVEFIIEIPDEDIEYAKRIMWKLGDNPHIIKNIENFTNIEILKVMLNVKYYGVRANITELKRHTEIKK